MTQAAAEHDLHNAPVPHQGEGPALLRAPALAAMRVPHCFTTRRGGVSRPPFDTLNFGNPSDLPPEQRDPRDTIAENWRRTLHALAIADASVVQVHQVHAADVLTIRSADLPASSHELASLVPGWGNIRADAIVTDDPRLAIAVRIADCAPVLIATREPEHEGRVVAAVHAGWRGVVGGVAIQSLRAMRALAPRADLVACVGPCIGTDAFEVGPEVHEAFERSLPGARATRPHPTRPGKFLADLRAALEHQLRSEGVAHVEHVGGCTFSTPDRFFSHRRDASRTGRMAAVIAPRRA